MTRGRAPSTLGGLAESITEEAHRNSVPVVVMNLSECEIPTIVMDDTQEKLQYAQAIQNSLKPEVVQCQFCKVKLDTKDDLMLHLVNQCPSIEKKDGIEDVEIQIHGPPCPKETDP